jgi:RNA polymerase-binding transcription factor DksA
VTTSVSRPADKAHRAPSPTKKTSLQPVARAPKSAAAKATGKALNSKAAAKSAPRPASAKAAPAKAVPGRAPAKATAPKAAAPKATAAATKAAPAKAAAAKATATKATAKAAATKAPAKAAPGNAPAKAAPAKAAPAKVTAARATVSKAVTKAPAAKAAPAKTAAKASAAAPGPAKKAPVKAKLGPYANEAKFLAEQKELLLTERAIYQGQATDLKAEADSLALEREPGDVQFDEESGEGGTVTVDRERDLALSAQALLAVEEIDFALERIRRRTYGGCERCGQPIPKPRLRALPYARMCVACKSGGLSRR